MLPLRRAIFDPRLTPAKSPVSLPFNWVTQSPAPRQEMSVPTRARLDANNDGRDTVLIAIRKHVISSILRWCTMAWLD